MWRKCAFSCGVFGHFETVVEVKEEDTMHDIKNKALAKLEEVLKTNRLDELSRVLQQLKPTYHIHGVTTERVKIEQNSTIWICSHTPSLVLGKDLALANV